MKAQLFLLTVFSMAVAVAYGVAFKLSYPSVDIDSSIASVLALLGIVTCIVVYFVARMSARLLVRRRRGTRTRVAPAAKSSNSAHRAPPRGRRAG